ncbi:hypothetical protein BESB_037880 [Besnoitia besnoiti]|uniref:Thioesterase domain-containing protein n=1 Tax=Besnoitia besnoiti TaxID=94643 RepID=A0A2A9MNN6_BESBE|nr:hypothetical protein BESB_037880 [Besnoitia besnoiti]PFH37330.1 hypothetical protein BESB_037880 [Besnoitia besnoiti]
MTRTDQRKRVLHPHFAKWFPRCVPKGFRENPAIRIFCFHGAGMDVTVWTGVGTPKAPTVNPLVTFCEKEDAQLLAAQLPGRSLRSKESVPDTIQDCAAQLLEVITPLASSHVPYVLVGYSMGCWIAYELACALAKKKQADASVRLPVRMILASMVSPDTIPKDRPWRETRNLSDQEFQEELRGWSCNDVLFQPDLWSAYGQLLRADHRLLDDYVPTTPENPLGVPCSVFRARDDLKLKSPSYFFNWFSLLERDCSAREKKVSALKRDANGDGVATSSIHSGIETTDRTPRSVNEPQNTGNGVHLGRSTPDMVKKSRGRASDTEERLTARIGVLDGNHGLLYNTECRAKFFEQIVELVEQDLLDFMYDGM